MCQSASRRSLLFRSPRLKLRVDPCWVGVWTRPGAGAALCPSCWSWCHVGSLRLIWSLPSLLWDCVHMCSCGHLCAQVCVCVHTWCLCCQRAYMHVGVHVRVHAHVCLSASMHVSTCAHVWDVHLCLHVHTHVCMLLWVMCVCVCACEFMCLHATCVCHCAYVPVYLGACTYVHMLVCAYVLICLCLSHACRCVHMCPCTCGVCVCVHVSVCHTCVFAHVCRGMQTCVCALVPVSPTGMSLCICVCPCIWGRTSMRVHVNECACVSVHTSVSVCACACMTNVSPHLLGQSPQGRVPSYQLVSGALGTAVVWLESPLTPPGVLSPLSLRSVWVLSVSPAGHLLRHREHFFAALSPPRDHCSLGPAGSGFLGSRPPTQHRAPGLKVGVCVWA